MQTQLWQVFYVCEAGAVEEEVCVVEPDPNDVAGPLVQLDGAADDAALGVVAKPDLREDRNIFLNHVIISKEFYLSYIF